MDIHNSIYFETKKKGEILMKINEVIQYIDTTYKGDTYAY